MKKILSIILSFSIVIGTTAFAATWVENGVATGQEGDVFVFLYEYGMDDKVMVAQSKAEKGGPMLDDEHALLMPITTAYMWGYEIVEENDLVKIYHETRSITIPMNENTATVDGKAIELFHKQQNGTTYIPYIALETLFDVTVEWDASKNCLSVKEKVSTPISLNEKAYRGTHPEILVHTLTVKNDKELNISIDGKVVKFDAKPFIDESDRTQVPIRAVAEMMNADVDWDAETRTVTISKDGKIIKIVIGSDAMTVDGKTVKMDTAAIIKDDRTYIPVRFVAEALGMTVEWVNG